MVKRTLSALLSAVLAVSLLLTGASAAEAPAWSVQSATWQDPNNVMLILGGGGRVYLQHLPRGERRRGIRAHRHGGGRLLPRCGGRVAHGHVLYRGGRGGGRHCGARSEPIRAGANGQKLSKVSVVMYHNFITEADEGPGRGV